MIRNQNIKANFNCVSITTETKEIDIWFSHGEAIGVKIVDNTTPAYKVFLIAINDFGTKTEPHIKYLDGGTKQAKAVRVPQRIINNLIENLFD